MSGDAGKEQLERIAKAEWNPKETTFAEIKALIARSRTGGLKVLTPSQLDYFEYSITTLAKFQKISPYWSWDNIPYDCMIDQSYNFSPEVQHQVLSQTLIPISLKYGESPEEIHKSSIRYLLINGIKKFENDGRRSLNEWDEVIQQLPNLQYLSFNSLFFYINTSQEAQELYHWAQSRNLKIRGMKVSSLSPPETLDEFEIEELKSFSIGNGLAEKTLERILSANTLHELSFSYHENNTHEDLLMLLRLPLQKLHIDASDDKSHSCDDSFAQSLMNHPELMSIEMYSSILSPDGIRSLLKIPQIKSLDIWGCVGHKFDPDEIAELEAIRPEVDLEISNSDE
ncbi:MAG: hypothetical protein P1V18_02755 [Candidatus Gracilibacteria bacterium]|nr:hypothetical protein [Candidatus Gracilibacteria bacterium]